jgi:hypothetical protein
MIAIPQSEGRISATTYPQLKNKKCCFATCICTYMHIRNKKNSELRNFLKKCCFVTSKFHICMSAITIFSVVWTFWGSVAPPLHFCTSRSIMEVTFKIGLRHFRNSHVTYVEDSWFSDSDPNGS